MRKDKYIRVSTAIGMVLTGGCGGCKLRKSGCCEGCRTQTILDLLDDVAKTGGVEIPQRHGRLIDADALFKAMFQCSDGSIIGDKGIDGWPFEATYAEIKRFIRQAPTIIPADPEGGADG